MKKIAAVLLSLIMLSSLFSCNSEKTNDNENTDDNTNTAEASSQEDIDAAPTAKTQAEVAIERYLNSLAYYPTPVSQTPLCECERLGHAYVDLDGDSVNELVIDCGSILILRYYEGCVYLYEFTFRQLYNLNTDGSYNWNHNGADFEYGENRIYFEGAELKTRELYRIVNNAEYYVEGKQVTEEELQKYIEDNPKTKTEFLPLEVSWQKEITPEEALQIASEYWGIKDGFTDYGAGSMWIYRIIMFDYRGGYYHIGLQVDHYGRDESDLRKYLSSRVEYVFVDSMTGECNDSLPTLGNGTPVYGKGEN